MDLDYWKKQEDEPLFPDIVWSRPESKINSGKLLIVGGHTQGFSAVAKCYQSATESGIGQIYLAIPSGLKKTVGELFPNIEYLEDTPLGSISYKSKHNLVSLINAADSVIFCGDLGNNSETVKLVDEVIPNLNLPSVICGDAVSAIKNSASTVLANPSLNLIANFGEIQRILSSAGKGYLIKSDMGVLEVVKVLHEVTSESKCSITTRVSDYIINSFNGEAVTTKYSLEERGWDVSIASIMSVLTAQNLGTPIELLSTATHLANQP